MATEQYKLVSEQPGAAAAHYHQQQQPAGAPPPYGTNTYVYLPTAPPQPLPPVQQVVTVEPHRINDDMATEVRSADPFVCMACCCTSVCGGRWRRWKWVHAGWEWEKGGWIGGASGSWYGLGWMGAGAAQ